MPKLIVNTELNPKYKQEEGILMIIFK